MLWMIGFGIIGFIGAFMIAREECDGFIGWFFGVLGILLFTSLIFSIGVIPALIVGIPLEKQWVETDEVELFSLRNADGIKGEFFLGTGTIGSEQYYFFYKEKGDAYQPGKVVADDSVIVREEDGRNDGLMKVYVQKFANPTYRLFAYCWSNEKYEFFIPAGSLKRNFVLQ